jgi:hypothetical protein
LLAGQVLNATVAKQKALVEEVALESVQELPRAKVHNSSPIQCPPPSSNGLLE